MNGVLIRRGHFKHRDTKDRHTGKRPCEDKDKDWSDGSKSRGIPRIAKNHQKLGERHESDPTQVTLLF